MLIGDDVSYRKLTPIECERLQTVPDNYTKHVSNTQRYKMLGNGWTVDVIAHILKSINTKETGHMKTPDKETTLQNIITALACQSRSTTAQEWYSWDVIIIELEMDLEEREEQYLTVAS